jgi:hypothetical protein
MMRNYSFAGPGCGADDPDDVVVVVVNEDNCPRGRCPEEGVHLVLMWSGDSYSKQNTWISADEDTYQKLEDMR